MNLLTLHKVLTNLEPPEKKTTKAEVDDKEETEENNVEDPTTKLLIARKKSSEKEKASSKLTREMVKYEEALDSLQLPRTATGWSGGGTNHKDLLPLLARVAQEILGIPCNSSKLETIFSIGGQVSNGHRAWDFFCAKFCYKSHNAMF